MKAIELVCSSFEWWGDRWNSAMPYSIDACTIPDGHQLPETNDPLQWLLALMNHPGAPLRLRMACAVALLPYFHERHR